jgi:hypothetical protein
MSTRLIIIDKAKYSLSGAQLCDEQLAGASLSTCDRRPTCVNISQDRYLLALDTNMTLVAIVMVVRLGSFTFYLIKTTFLITFFYFA